MERRYTYFINLGGEEIKVAIKQTDRDLLCIEIGNKTHQVSLERLQRTSYYLLSIDEKIFKVKIEGKAEDMLVTFDGVPIQISVMDELSKHLSLYAPQKEHQSNEVVVKSHMPGFVTRVNVSVGDAVKEGDGLLNLEAMKMENELYAPRSGIIDKVHVKQGQTVGAGAPLVTIK